jgi:hypothetical protein
MTDDAITPALTPDEWTTYLPDDDRLGTFLFERFQRWPNSEADRMRVAANDRRVGRRGDLSF